MGSKHIQFILAIGFQVLVILVIILFKLSILAGGQEVMLRIEPVDPRDPLRGDYVTFRYEISSISGAYLTGEVRNGDIIYVPLEYYDGYWQAADGVSRQLPQTYPFIKGRVTNVDGRLPSVDSIEMRYGIEEYFIPEGTGQALNFWDHDVGAKVVVDDKGNPVLKQLYLDGDPWP